jgi:hypothetical protein
MQQKARLRLEKLKRKNFQISIQKTEQSLIFAVWEKRRLIR